MGCNCNSCCTGHAHSHGHHHGAIGHDADNRGKAQRLFSDYWRPGLSFLMLILGAVFTRTHKEFVETNYLDLVWYILAYLPVGLPVLKEAWEAALHKDFFSEFTLMAVATIGAFAIKEYPEGVAVMLFYTLGEYFQGKAVSKARNNIGDLLDKRPDKVAVIRDSRRIVVDTENVSVGEVIELKPGERIPLDGKMLTEYASFDTAALTGESVPKTYRKGQEILAGMIILDKVVQIEVNKPYDDSTLARILKMVEDASDRKAPAELFMRKFARIYTPAAIGLSVLIVLLPFLYSFLGSGFIFDFDTWFYRALVFLVISCPCALVVSIPLGYFGGIGAASKHGVLFKGGNYLDAITNIDTVVFDKTGTLTKGVFEVNEVETADHVIKEHLLSLAISVESNSNHPISKAVVRYAGTNAASAKKAEKVEEIAGFGLKALVDEKEVLVGNHKLLDRYNVNYPKEIKDKIGTIVIIAENRTYQGFLLLSDEIKEDSKEAVNSLRRQGVQHILMLSGDKKEIVDKIADELGIDKAFGDLLPLDKVAYIEKLKNERHLKTAFVGDGMNDAPVLALSNVGIAMGGLGSDAAIETADVVIQNDQPSKVAQAIHIGKVTKRIILQNIVLAIGVKLTILALGILGLTSLWAAIFADVGVALLAILNSIRILRYFDSDK